MISLFCAGFSGGFAFALFLLEQENKWVLLNLAVCFFNLFCWWASK